MVMELPTEIPTIHGRYGAYPLLVPHVIAIDASKQARMGARYLRETMRPKWVSLYGPYLQVCDGTADDVQIAAALAAQPATGEETRLIGATFTTAAQINLPALAHLIGQGMEITTIKAAASWGSAVQVLYVNGDDVLIEGMTIDCNGDNQTLETICIRDAGTSIDRLQGKNLWLKNCIKGTWPRATALEGADLLLENVYASNCDYGFVVGYNAVRPHLRGCRTLLRAAAAGNSLHMRHSTDANIENCYFDNNGASGEGVDIHNFTNLRWTNNHIRRAGDCGLLLTIVNEAWVANADHGRHFSVTGGSISECGGAGIKVGRFTDGSTHEVEHGVISGVEIFNNQESQNTTMAGIWMTGCADVEITGCPVYDAHADVVALLASNAANGATTITLASGKGVLFHVNEYVVITDTTPSSQDILISNISGDVLTVTQLTDDFTTALGAQIAGKNTQLWGIRETLNGGGQFKNGTGTATGSPISYTSVGVKTPEILTAGTFTISLPAGNTGEAASGATWVVTGSPVALVGGDNTITVTNPGGASGTITVTLDAAVNTNNNNHIHGNDVRGSSTAGIVKLGANTIVRNNLGYVTENSGTATVLNTTTSIAVSHGLAAAPTRVQITPRENPTNAVTFWWVDTLTATQFTIRINADPGASGLDFDWHAQIGEG